MKRPGENGRHGNCGVIVRDRFSRERSDLNRREAQQVGIW